MEQLQLSHVGQSVRVHGRLIDPFAPEQPAPADHEGTLISIHRVIDTSGPDVNLHQNHASLTLVYPIEVEPYRRYINLAVDPDGDVVEVLT